MNSINPEIAVIFQNAWETYGTEAQMRVLMEECAELCETLVVESLSGELCGELADVQIMIDQFRYIIENYLGDPNFFNKIEEENIDQYQRDFEDGSTETSLEIFLAVIYGINHFNRKKISSEDICKILLRANHRIQSMTDEDFVGYSNHAGYGIFKDTYHIKLNRLSGRLGLA